MSEAQHVEGFDWKPRADMIFVADLGQISIHQPFEFIN